MPTFALEEIKGLKGPIKFFFFLFEGKCEVDEFLDTFEKNGRKKDIAKLYASMEALANKMILPPKKHNYLQGRNDEKDVFEEWEIKQDAIRLYYFNLNNEKIIVFGAIKNKKKAQQKDEKKLRSIKLEYLKSIGYDIKK